MAIKYIKKEDVSADTYYCNIYWTVSICLFALEVSVGKTDLSCSLDS